MLRRWLALAALSALLVFFCSREARADQPGGHTLPVAVLGFDSDGADEQADALTGGVRSKVRTAAGWSLVETTQSLGMLTAGLKCQQRPNPECQQKIAEQIKSDRYVWGIVGKSQTMGQVQAEVHLYQKGKPDFTFTETFSDNLRDPNDDKGIGKVGARILERLSGAALGSIVVKSSDATGEVVLDGEKKIPLANGTVRFDAAPGSHSVEVSGGATQKRNVLVTAGQVASVDFTSNAPVAGPEQPGEASKPFPTRKVVGASVAGAGVVLGIVSVLSFTAYLDNIDQGKAAQPNVPKGEAPCDSTTGDQKNFCQADKDAKRNSAVAWITGGVGVAAIGVGAYLFFTDKSSSESAPPPAAKYKTRVLPAVGSTNGVFVTGSF